MTPHSPSSPNQQAIWSKLLETSRGKQYPGQSGEDWLFFCPCHEDGKKSGKRSLSVKFEGDGSTKVHCFACQGGKEFYSLLSSTLNLPRTIFDGETPYRTQEKEKDYHLEGTYIYLNERGEKVFRQRKYRQKDGSKKFGPDYWDGSGWVKSREWPGEKPPVPLYNLPSLLAAIEKGEKVYLVEGEKDADRLISGGLVATTNVNGAGHWKEEYSASLSGANVILLGDNDSSGQARVEKLASSLQGKAKSLKVLKLPGLGPKEDVSDWLEKGLGTISDLSSLADSSPSPLPSPKKRFQFLRDYEFETRPPKRWLLDQFLGVGDFGMIAGQPGAGKSFVVLDLCMSLVLGLTFAGKFGAERGASKVLYMASEGHDGFSSRFRAAKAKYGLRVGEPLGDFVLSEMVPNFFQASGEESTDIFLEELVSSGFKPDLVVVDTFHDSITGANENDSGDAGVVLKNIQKVRQALGCALLVVHHTGKSGESERGSSAYRGKADFVYVVESQPSGGTLECRKIKDGPYFDPVSFSLAKNDLSDRKEFPRVSWQGEGDFRPVLTPRQREVLDVLKASSEPLTSSEVASRLGENSQSQKNNITTVLSSLHRQGMASRRPRNPGSVNARNPYVFQAFESFSVSLHMGGESKGVFSNHPYLQEEEDEKRYDSQGRRRFL